MSFLSFSVMCLYVVFGIVAGKYYWQTVFLLVNKRVSKLQESERYPRLHKDIVLRVYIASGALVTFVLLQGTILLMNKLV